MSGPEKENSPPLLPLTEELIGRLAAETGALAADDPPLEGERRTVFLEVAMGALRQRDWQLLRAVLEHDTIESAAEAAGIEVKRLNQEVYGFEGSAKPSIVKKLRAALASSPRWGEVQRVVGLRELGPEASRQNFLGDGRWFAPAYLWGELRHDGRDWVALAALAVLVDVVDRTGRCSATRAHEVLGNVIASRFLSPLQMMGYIEYDGVQVRIVRTPLGYWQEIAA